MLAMNMNHITAAAAANPKLDTKPNSSTLQMGQINKQ